MRKLLLATSAIALLGGSALAAGSSATTVTATNPPSCSIVSQSPNLDLGTVVDVAVAGEFSYICNFNGSPTFTFTSANGGVTTAENGGGTADYGIYLNDTAYSGAPSSWQLASAATGGAVYNNISTATVNTTATPSFALGLASALPVAGSYSDTLTIDIAP